MKELSERARSWFRAAGTDLQELRSEFGFRSTGLMVVAAAFFLVETFITLPPASLVYVAGRTRSGTRVLVWVSCQTTTVCLALF